jgi:hypothetical protein
LLLYKQVTLQMTLVKWYKVTGNHGTILCKSSLRDQLTIVNHSIRKKSIIMPIRQTNGVSQVAPDSAFEQSATPATRADSITVGIELLEIQNTGNTLATSDGTEPAMLLKEAIQVQDTIPVNECGALGGMLC